MQTRFVRKSQFFFGLSFLVLIGAGTLVLHLPFILRNGGVMDWEDALFTSTSAICLTGLSVVPMNDLSLFGQVVILGLVQLGGIGIMALSAAILMGLGAKLGFSGSMVISSINENLSLRHAEGYLRTVIRLTLGGELAGAVVLFCVLTFWSGQPVLRALWNAGYLSVSSFCNAGIIPDGAEAVTRIAPVKFCCSLLCILGGLGIYVIFDLTQVFQKRQNRLTLHSRVVLVSSLILLVLGTVVFRGIGLKEGGFLGWLDAWFLAVTTRTCGLPGVDVNQLTDPGLIFASLLMLIGGAPGSTTGGIKVTAVSVAAAAILNTCAGNRETLMFKQRIPMMNVLRSFTIIILFVTLFCLGTLILRWLSPEIKTMEIGFEAASALSTTGLSIGNTTGMLPRSGRIFVMILMFVGRIGPFAMMLSLMGQEKSSTISRPEGKIIIS